MPRDRERRRHGDEVTNAAHNHSFFAGNPGRSGAERAGRTQSGLARAGQQFERPDQTMAAHFAHGRVTGELDRAEATEESILALAMADDLAAVSTGEQA